MKLKVYGAWKMCLDGCFRSMCSYQFLLAVLLVGFGYYFGVGGTQSEICGDLSDLLFETMLNADLAVLTVLGAALPGAAMFCQDEESGEYSLLLARSSPYLYGVTRMFSCAVAGGLANVLGRCLLLCLGAVSGYGTFEVYEGSRENVNFWYDYYRCNGNSSEIWKYVAAMLFCCFCIGMVLAAAGMLISAFVSNMYAAYIFPYLLLLLAKLSIDLLPWYLQLPSMWMGVSMAPSPLGNWMRTGALTLCYLALFLVLFLWKIVPKKR